MQTCFYCGVRVTAETRELDHFPVPAHLGGENVVPACRPCHDAKDRFRLSSLSETMLAEIVSDFPRLNRATKILLARVIRLALESQEASAEG